VVVVAYRPKPGCDQALLELARDHVPLLRRLGLATDRAPVLMRAADGTLLEVFEWQDGAIERAHAMPEIQALWGRYAAVCDYRPLNSLPEAASQCAGFTPVA
jgi:hypothetical protein